MLCAYLYESTWSPASRDLKLIQSLAKLSFFKDRTERRKLIQFLAFLALLFICTGESMAKSSKPTESTPDSTLHVQARPVLRISLAQGLQKIEFRVSGRFDLVDLEGTPLLRSQKADCRWLARPVEAEPAEFNHSVLIGSYADERNARRLCRSLQEDGYEDVEIRPIGRPVEFESGNRYDNRRFRVLCGKYSTEEEALELLKLFRNEYRPRILRERVAPPRGQVEFTDADFKKNKEVPGGFRIVPKTRTGHITLYRLPVDKIPNSPLEDRVYTDLVEFRVDNEGQLAVINELHIDTYLKGVLPSELDACFPEEAHKAQAVAARGTVLCMLGMKHMNDDFDYCAGIHCQSFSGGTHTSAVTDAAVEATSGQVLVWRSKICDSVYHACCGGYGESKENIWTTPAEQVLRGRMDCRDSQRRRHRVDLSREAEFHGWILEPPACNFCRIADSDLPELNERSRKYFRWKEVYHRQELEKVIREKTGVDVGTLYDIVPVQRGVSGRIIELELIGSRRNLRLQKELKIREALSPSLLFRSAFHVHVEMNETGTPVTFTLLGAGSGHGVGLCQVGAVGMALGGSAYGAILEHYYPATTLERLYKIK